MDLGALPVELVAILRQHWGHQGFRPLQLQALQATLQGKDSLVILPTGGGKSILYQLPPLTKTYALSVVVTPLLALAMDQVNRCEEVTIEACTWNSETSETTKQMISKDILAGEPSYKLLYTTPESLRHPALREALLAAASNGCLMSFAIDEAHCVAEWGHNFRPAYLQLSTLKDDFPSIPIAAFTATATHEVQRSISETLQLRNPVKLQGSFNRSNIKYQVRCKEIINDGTPDAILKDLVSFLQAQEGSGIVYAHLRATCDWVASALIDADIDAAAYHAGKSTHVRRSIQQDWVDGSLTCVVATIAFGLGIDKPDCRYVVHWNPSSSLEGFYQESGRAGRDGQPCTSVLYASTQDMADLHKLEKGTRRGAVQAVNEYALAPGCRRKKLLSFFGEKDHRSEPNAIGILAKPMMKRIKRGGFVAPRKA
ncbi:hypothetical protein WJX84_002643 [Apatococcus fuscideae]|uniref:DNA 3'-5' helicase n=1 Tax=Apatococcus fuscideae TaxID=2026836 RepID=A0AAW1T2W6_9CHLO